MVILRAGVVALEIFARNNRGRYLHSPGPMGTRSSVPPGRPFEIGKKEAYTFFRKTLKLVSSKLLTVTAVLIELTGSGLRRRNLVVGVVIGTRAAVSQRAGSTGCTRRGVTAPGLRLRT